MSYAVLFRYAAERDAERAQDWYRVHDEHQVIEVLAVVHERQDGKRLQSRLG